MNKLEWAICCDDAKRNPDGTRNLTGVERSVISCEGFPVQPTLCVVACVSDDYEGSGSSEVVIRVSVLGPNGKPVIEPENVTIQLVPVKRQTVGDRRAVHAMKVEFPGHFPGRYTVELESDSNAVSLPLHLTAYAGRSN